MKRALEASSYRKPGAICFFIIAGLFIITYVLFACPGCDNASPDHPGDFTPTLPNEAPGEGTPYTTTVEEFSIVNSAGNTVYGLIRRPDPEVYPAYSFAGVIMVPSGIVPGRIEALSEEVTTLAEAGMVVVCFNSEGRYNDSVSDDIASEGEEDFNGFLNQDTLSEIFEFTMGLAYVIQDNIGIWTQSFGITMGAGCAARHPEIPIKYIVDAEGPSTSFVTSHEPWALYSPPDHPSHDNYQTAYEIFGHYSTYRDPSSENLVFWEEREAIRFIGEFNGMYLRLQAEWDHAQPPSNASEIEMFHDPPTWWQGKHACDMVNAAIDGGVPWVRVNLIEQGNNVNERYDADDLPAYIAGELNDTPMAPIEAVLEMARSEPVHE